MDLLAEDDAHYLGRFGPNGQRRANFTIQAADLLLCMAASMSVGEVGFDTAGFAPGAKRVMVNISGDEMDKPHFKPDVAIRADVRSFVRRFVAEVSRAELPAHDRWLAAVAGVKREYRIVTDEYSADPKHVNTYLLAWELSKAMGEGEVLVTGNGTDVVSVHHSFAVKPGQRLIAPYNLGAMGFDLPAAVGAAYARPGERVVLVTGDGSIELNVQELLTIGHNRLDVKVFVLNNGGYESIRATQNNFFEGRWFGCHEDSGVANPRFDLLAGAYGLEYRAIRTNAELASGIAEVLGVEGPVLCEVNVSFDQEKMPRIRSRRREDGTLESPPLDDQWPFLQPEQRAATIARLRGED
jgi:acetolactate synthase-1/2/3 large subunit